MSRSPSEYSSSMTKVPSTSETLQCRGGFSASVRTKPIVLNSMSIPKLLLFAPVPAHYHFDVRHTEYPRDALVPIGELPRKSLPSRVSLKPGGSPSAGPNTYRHS